jgi:hypothetical protein
MSEWDDIATIRIEPLAKSRKNLKESSSLNHYTSDRQHITQLETTRDFS